jgi:hypothetical protein
MRKITLSHHADSNQASLLVFDEPHPKYVKVVKAP